MTSEGLAMTDSIMVEKHRDCSAKKTENITMIVAIGILVYLLWLTNPSRTKSSAGRRPVYTVTEIGVAVALL